MAAVRVECVACHVAPKEDEVLAGTGQTFRAAEQACLGCHGAKYRGMLERWVESFARMRATVAPRVAAARAALAAADPKDAKLGRARRLVEDAELNARFEAAGRGAHNVFYGANLLRLASGWADEALALLAQPPVVGTDDALVRGGYCAALCHEPGGVKFSETVVFKKQKLPHRRHVTELGATCTACHSAEAHKALAATAATCSSCHHSPRNDRCDTCHPAQAGFYRGTLKTDLAAVEPNVMAAVVPCTGCHDLMRKHSRRMVGQQCVACHEPPYQVLADEWTVGYDQDLARVAATLGRADAAVAAARRAGRAVGEAPGLATAARGALDLVRRARGAHNPGVADALIETARQKAEAALDQARGR
jgi:hypothetical protein